MNVLQWLKSHLTLKAIFALAIVVSLLLGPSVLATSNISVAAPFDGFGTKVAPELVAAGGQLNWNHEINGSNWRIWITGGCPAGAGTLKQTEWSGTWQVGQNQRVKVTAECTTTDGGGNEVVCLKESHTIWGASFATHTPEPTRTGPTRTPRATNTAGPTPTKKPTATKNPWCLYCEPSPTATEWIPTSTPVLPTETLVSTSTDVPATFTSTAMPANTFAPAEEEEVVEEAGECPLQPYMRDRRTDGRIYLEWRNGSTPELPLVADLWKFEDGDYYNPSIHISRCLYSTEVRDDQGNLRVDLYDFGYTLIRRFPGYKEPEFPLDPEETHVIHMVRVVDGMLVKFDWKTSKVIEELGVRNGKDPITLVTEAGTYIGMTNRNDGTLQVLTPSGELKSTIQQCDRPEANPHTEAFECRTDSKAVSYDVGNGEITVIRDSWLAAAVNPSVPGQVALTGLELVVDNAGQEIAVSEEIGFGSDWSGYYEETKPLAFYNPAPVESSKVTVTIIGTVTATAMPSATPTNMVVPPTSNGEQQVQSGFGHLNIVVGAAFLGLALLVVTLMNWGKKKQPLAPEELK